MHRIVRRVINEKYRPYLPDILVAGSYVPFDTYIKRYNDYVIIIEAGTLLNDELYQKVQHNDAIFVLMHDSLKVAQYMQEQEQEVKKDAGDGAAYRERVDDALSLPCSLETIDSTEQKLRHVYGVSYRLVRAVFEQSDSRLPIEALRSCADEIGRLVCTSANIMAPLIRLIPGIYSTHHHNTNVAFFSAILANAVGLSGEETKEIAFAGLVHDIGKIRIDQMILLKPGSLREDEYEQVQKHAEYGFELLSVNGISSQRILDGVKFHHERLDASGYPQKLKGKMIPRSARIIGVCDAFDALTTDRTFRPRYTSFEALVQMKKEMSKQFEEKYIDTFIRLLKD